MATSIDIVRPQSDAFSTVSEQQLTTAIINLDMPILSDMRIERIFFQLPVGTTYALKITFASGQVFTLAAGKTTSSDYMFAIGAGSACPVGSVVNFTTDNVSGTKSIVAIYRGV